MAIPESFLQELIDRSPIEDVVGEYVRLTKRSGANLFGLCPFHSEKTPSFSVSPDKQIYHCFGCGKGGGVINFVMEAENLSFVDAVHFLARRAGMQVPETDSDPQSSRRERMLALNRDAARFFYRCLCAPGGAAARDYVQRRGISPRMVKVFGLGFAPDSWNALADAMRQKGYTRLELVQAGLVRESKKGSGIYDTFRNRLMFPVIDVRGSVIGFSGRILDEGEPKYMNSPETLVFNKSRNLFALNLAKKSKHGYMILAEGNIDIVSLHQAGFDSAVASLGTSLTAEQARLMSRYTKEVIVAYDNDGAGQKAAQRAISILEKLDLKVRVLQMQGAKDPDEFIRSRGADAFQALLQGSEEQVHYRLSRLAAQFDLHTDEGRLGYLKAATELIASLPGGLEREIYAGRVAEQAKVDRQAVLQEVTRRSKQNTARSRKRQEREMVRSVRPPTVGSGREEIRFENPRAAMAERGILQLLLLDPGLFRGREEPKPEQFQTPFLRRLYELLRRRIREGASVNPAMLGEDFSPEEISYFTQLWQDQAVDLRQGARALEDYIQILREEARKAEEKNDLRAFAAQLKKTKGYGG